MEENTVIKVENVTKDFRLPHEKNDSIKGAFVNFYRRNKSYELQKALNDISFEVKKGEFFGIVGRNGSGKSTLLKLLAGIYMPTSGAVHVKGKLTPFIELGVGFNPELTGRENVFLNGALLGFNRKEMQRMYKGIVEFAELGKFMDQKLKNYSSGMQVRLAFSIAIRVKSDILMLDEVLAVGDEAFQQKCVDVFEQYKSRKQTVILVTHDMETVRRFCTRAMLINDSEIQAIGEPNEIATKYSKLNAENTQETLKAQNQKIESSDIQIKIVNKKSDEAPVFKVGGKLKLEVSWSKAIKGVHNVGVAVIKNSGEYMFGANTIDDDIQFVGNKIEYSVDLDLGPGKYYLMAGLFGKTKYDNIDFMGQGPQFMIEGNTNETQQGLVRLRHTWGEKDAKQER